jgi:probable DNA repair protein
VKKAELLSRLAEGHAAGITVVTPNRRLSQALVADFDLFQAGKASWEAADVLPFDAFVQRLYEDALYADPERALPMLLSASQEEQLWREIVGKAGLLAPEAAAAGCAQAWRLAHAWRIEPARSTEDSGAFKAWSEIYSQRAKSDVDAARLPDLVVKNLDALRKPRLLVAYAFDILPPQTRAFLDACKAAGVQVEEISPERKSGRVTRASYASAKEELEAAAAWARARLEAGATRIGVVVPDLAQRRKEAARVFSRVMQPGYNLPGAAKGPMPFNISLGLPLVQYPAVALALTVIAFSRESLSFEETSRLVRSPFIAGGEKERSQRAALDARLRRRLDATVSLPKLIGELEKRTTLRERLEKLFGLRDDGLFADKSPSDWARHFSTLLDAVGFPGDRTLDSAEYQTLQKWHEVLGEFSRLERVAKVFSFHDALKRLKSLCEETLFQPESGGAPVQVLGVLESAGLELDCLWVSGLTDEAWPLDASPNPFLPLAAQRAAGLPEASVEGSLALDRRITEGWLGAADEVVLSFHTTDEDRAVLPSPLILDVPEGKVAIPVYPRLRDTIFSNKKLLSLEDGKAPPFASQAVRGGTRVLTDQAACPFRAFARWRLRAEALEEPVDGLDAAERGRLLHALMKELWVSIKNSSSLEGNLETQIALAAEAAVKEIGLEGRFAEMERARLARLAGEWLEVERKRAPFEVVATEEKRTLEVGGLQFSGRIDRLDKIEGGHALIDYKTSRAPSPKHWEPPRPDDAQLPIYAVTSDKPIAAVAFAKIRPGEMRFMGFSREEKVIEGVRKAKAWGPLLEDWRKEVESLAGAFARGEARVDPKRELQTCRYCDLQTLCRVYEKLNPLKEDESMEGTDE